MKKIIIFLLVTMMVLSFVSCRDNATTKGKQGTLIVDGRTVPSHTTVYPEYATVSLCDVISALGFELSWDGTDRASFVCNRVTYEICISEKTLVSEGSSNNYLVCAPGHRYYVCNIYEGDLIIDDVTLRTLFQSFIKYPVDVTIEQETLCVILSVT